MQIVPLTIWREARSEGTAGMTGVYHVITSRTLASPHNGWPADPERVCLQAYQFSCWNSGDPQRDLYPQPGDPQYAEAVSICQLDPPDPTNGATAYWDVSIPTPNWAVGKTITSIGRLRFVTVDP